MCLFAGLIATAVRRRGSYADVRTSQGQRQPPRLPHQQKVLRQMIAIPNGVRSQPDEIVPTQNSVPLPPFLLPPFRCFAPRHAFAIVAAVLTRLCLKFGCIL